MSSLNCFPSHVEYDDVNVHDVVEVVPLAAMVQTKSPETCIFIYLLAHGSHVLPEGSSYPQHNQLIYNVIVYRVLDRVKPDRDHGVISGIIPG